MSNGKIFIQIASYRDPELIKTIDDCLDKANNKDNLVFSIAHQFSDSDTFSKDLDKYRSDSRFKIIDIPYQEAKGACWARNKLQQQYNNEEYTLQLDSHHRFVQNWDTKLIEMLKDLRSEGYNKPLITGYISSYDPENDPNGRVNVPWQMNFDRFIPEGAVFFLPSSIPDYQKLSKPIRARFYSAHFCFTLGQFCKEVPHDPEYYFHGEEISIAARAFTWGYDLFHSHKIIAWHEYTRKGRTKQWDDDKKWVEKNNSSHLRNRKLFEIDGEKRDVDFGIYGFGTERSLEDYEKYAGISFKKRAVQKHTIENKYPPNPVFELEEDYENSFLKIFKHCIDISYSQVPENDYDFWVVAFHDKENNTVFRKDADRLEIDRMMNDRDKYCKIWREFQTEEKPYSWAIWPHSISKGWMNKIEGKL